MPKIEFKAQGYLEKSYLDKDGSKHITFELSALDAVKIAKLELMGRDLNNHLPILLELRITEAKRILSNAEKKPKIERREFKG